MRPTNSTCVCSLIFATTLLLLIASLPEAHRALAHEVGGGHEHSRVGQPVVRGPKDPSEALVKIREAKARGESYPGMIWHAAEAEYLTTREDARAALDLSHKDGGSNDLNATPIDATPYQDSGTTVGKGNDFSLSSCLSSGTDTAEEAWYVMTFDVAVSLSISTTCSDTGPASYDTRIAVLDSNRALLECNDDDPACGQPNYQSRISDLVLAPGTYYAIIDGYNGTVGPYEFNASWVEEATICDGSNSGNATPIDLLPFSESSSTVAACDDILIDCELATNASGPDRWYRLDFAESVLLDVRTTCDDLDMDSRIAILSGSLDVLYCNDDDPLCTTHQSEIEDALLDPGIYYVVVDSPEDGAGSFTVEVDTTHAPPGEVVDLLPDITVIESDLYDNEIDNTVEPGRVHLRLSNATANLGDGKLYLYGVDPGAPTPTHEVRQRIWRSDGTWYDRAAGQFVYHPGHNHIHIEGWAQYNLREILPADGVGPIIASGTKTSFCIIDLRVQDSSLPSYVPGGEFHECASTIQGLSAGWADVYSKSLVDQWIDVTEVPDGEYWLESLADPVGNIAEKDETNNTARIKVTIGAPAPINPDPYEPNTTAAEAEARPTGTNNSPNLGPCAPSRTLSELTIHEVDNDDFFRFYLPAVGGVDDHVRIDFINGQGDLDLHLLDAGGSQLAQSNSTSDEESISLEGRPAGWYFVRVFGFNGAMSPGYSLSIDPSINGAPTIEMVDPPLGDTTLVQSIEAFPVTWTSSDPESNDTWVSIWVNSAPTLDGNEFFMETSLHTPADLGLYILATTYLPLGTYYVYAEITDGGSVVGDWSEGTLTLVPTAVDAPGALAGMARMLPSAPNPFNPATVLRFELESPSQVDLAVYDLQGRRVRALASRQFPAGLHQLKWDGRDESGRNVASGIYLAQFRAGEISSMQKLVLLK